MTSDPMPPLPDPRRILAKLTADVRAFEARAERTGAKLAASGSEVEGDHLTLGMLGAHITSVTFRDSALGASPAQLSEDVRRAVVAGVARTNRSSADVVRHAFGDETAARGVEEAAPDDVREEQARQGLDTPAEAPAPTHLTPMTPEEQRQLLEDVMADDSVDDEPDELAELARQLDYTPSPGAPEEQQALFEAEMDRIKAHAASLPALMGAIEGTADSEAVEVTVNAAGALVTTRFHAAFARGGTEALSEAFMDTYARARADAGARLSAALAEGGFATSASTLRDLGL